MHSPSRKGDVESATIASSTNQADTHRATQYSYTPSNILNIAFLISIIALFYVSGAATVVSLQQLMQTHPHPFLWCGVQFLFSYVLSAIYFWIQGAKLSLPTIEFGVPLAAAVCYALGLVFSNIALEYVEAPFLETVRSTECLTTMLLGVFYLHERASLRCLLTLLPIVGGVYISCQQTAKFSAAGLVWLLLSNLAFSGRSVASRLLQERRPKDMDPMKLFADVSITGLVLLLPVIMLLEGQEIYQSMFFPASSLAPASTAASITVMGWLSFPALVLFNGAAFTVCNALSFLVLHRTDLLTHCVVIVFRRVFTIFVAARCFGITLSEANLSGVAVSVAGVLLYSYFKYAERISPVSLSAPMTQP